MSDQSREQVVKFLELTGIDKCPDIFAEGFAYQFCKPMGLASDDEPNPDISDSMRAAAALVTKTMQEKKTELRELIIAAYQNEFSDVEIDELVRFYSSDAGRRLVTIGGIQVPASNAANGWGVSAMQSIETEISTLLA